MWYCMLWNRVTWQICSAMCCIERYAIWFNTTRFWLGWVESWMQLWNNISWFKGQISYLTFATHLSSNGWPMCSKESQWTSWVKAPRKKRTPNPPRDHGVFQRPTVFRHMCGQTHCCMETWTMCLPSRQRVAIPFTTYTHALKHIYHPRCQSRFWVLRKTFQARVHRK